MLTFDLPLKLQKSAGVPVTAEVKRLIREADAARDEAAWPKAAEVYRQALARDPALTHIWVQLGHALKEAGDTAEAEIAYRRAIELAPGVSDSHLQLGHLLKLQQRVLDAVKAYVTALELAPDSPEPLRELLRYAKRGMRIESEAFRRAMETSFASDAPEEAEDGHGTRREFIILQELAERLLREGSDEAQALAGTLIGARRSLERLDTAPRDATVANLIFDVTDLIHHFNHSRQPSGIQRVQLETIAARLRHAPAPVCYLSSNGWSSLPGRLVLELCDAALAHGETSETTWPHLLKRLMAAQTSAASFQFPKGAWLVALGTSWHSEYLLHLRAAKIAHGIRYAPYVHDLIPLKRPEFCLTDVVRDYIAWLIDVFDYADAFFTNSESTRCDLLKVAEQMGRPLDPSRVATVRLDADIRKPTGASQNLSLRRWGLAQTPYVLFVSTIEPRKNHVAAFAAWEALLRKHGPVRTPKLICVGGRGWMNEHILSALEQNERLKRQVMILSGLSDPELALLYSESLFTLYPSHYEGWGLPITESLCYGKIPVIADNSSLPEAGAGFAEVYKSGSDADLLGALEHLIFDRDYRDTKTAAIRSGFRPRAWIEIAVDIDRAVAAWVSDADQNEMPDRSPIAPPVKLGRYYPIARNRLTQVTPDTVHGGQLRHGTEWHALEDWGCWSKLSGLSLAARVPPIASGRLAAYVGVQGLPGEDSAFACSIQGVVQLNGRLPAWATRWLPLMVNWPNDRNQILEIRINLENVVDLGIKSDSADHRIVGPGVIGLYLADATDTSARLNIIEAITLGGLDLMRPASGEDHSLPRDN